MWLECLLGEAETTEADPGHIVEGLCTLLSHEDLIFRQQGPREWLSRGWCPMAEATAVSLLEANLKNLGFPAQPAQPGLLSSFKSWGPMSRKPNHGVEGPCCSGLFLLIAVTC